ncbi:MAG: trypsin-like peptidase domain-containing protein [Isosphaeraceae bacterium]|nr:trypsin-like peptidase domain-containing protein [Isosphaeraceae bacterium]
MKRAESPALLIATLALGLSLGAWLDRAVRPLSAGGVGEPSRAPAEPVAPRPVDDQSVYARLDQQYSLIREVDRTFELVAKSVSPSVVHIVAVKTGKRNGERRDHEFEETGSGVIVRADAADGLYVLTNNHVVSGATPEEVSIFLHDGRSLRPSKIWTDSRADIAVLELPAKDLPAARMGDSDRVAVGSWVLAVGSPFGLTHSVSQGIISGRGRHEADLELAGVENQDFLQTDAAINPGNSGGPLVNLKGEVVGLNIAILSNGGGSEGVGFSIPVNLARWIMNQLITKGRVSRGALGVKLQPNFEAETARALGLDRPRGAWIDSVDRSSPAAKAGIRVGDVVLRFNETEVFDLNHLINLVSMAPIGKPADLVIWRDRREIALRIVVGDKDAGAKAPAAEPAPARGDGMIRRPSRTDAAQEGTGTVLGLELATLNGKNAGMFGLPESMQGAVVTKVEPDSPLATYFRPLDVVHRVGELEVRSAEAAAAALSARSDVEHLRIGVHRIADGMIHSLEVRLP